MKDYLINSLLLLIGIILSWVYFMIGGRFLDCFFDIVDMKMPTFIFLYTYVFVIPLILILLKKIKEIILS